MELEKNWKKHESVIGLTPNAVGFFTCDTDCGDELFEKVGE